MSTFPELANNLDLYRIAEALLHKGAPRKRLFTFQSFVKDFNSLTQDQQDKVWEGLMHDRNGTAIPLVPYEVLDTWFNELCRHPDTFDWGARVWSGETSCPEPWIRKQMAYRFNEVLLGRRAPQYTTWYRGDGQGLRIHNRRSGEFSDQWLHAMRYSLYGRMDKTKFLEWIEDTGLERVLVHELSAFNGSMRYTESCRKLVIHPASMEKYEAVTAKENPETAKKRRQRASKKEREEYEASKAQAQDRSQNQLVYAETDAALINLGGGVKDLGKAMKERANADKMPSINEVWARITLGPAFELISEDRWPALEAEYAGYLRLASRS